MEKIYQIPKSQLVVIIVFGIIGELVTITALLDSYDPSNLLGFLSVFIPFLIIFYCVGWKHYNKKNIFISGGNELFPEKNYQFCIKCGKKNILDSKYCINCGDLLDNKLSI